MSLIKQLNSKLVEGMQDKIVKKYSIDELDKVPGTNMRNIGYSSKNQKWYGWSHRAICGFGKGDMVFNSKWGEDKYSEGELDKIPFTKRGAKRINSMKQAREAAINFFHYVS